jgi:hypothetical protein
MNADNFKNSMKSLNLMEFHRNKTLIILRSNREYFNELAENNFTRSRLASLGFSPDNFTFRKTFHLLYNKLFKLTPNVRTKYEQFLAKAKPNTSTKLICLQIRVGGLRMNGVLDNVEFTSKDAPQAMWSFVENNFVTRLKNQSLQYNIFLSTDTQAVEDEAIKRFGDKLVVNHGKHVHIDNIELNTGGKECGDAARTILDFHCMRECDMAVVSAGSQYGQFALMQREKLENGSFYTFMLPNTFLELKK